MQGFLMSTRVFEHHDPIQTGRQLINSVKSQLGKGLVPVGRSQWYDHRYLPHLLIVSFARRRRIIFNTTIHKNKATRINKNINKGVMVKPSTITNISFSKIKKAH